MINICRVSWEVFLSCLKGTVSWKLRVISGNLKITLFKILYYRQIKPLIVILFFNQSNIQYKTVLEQHLFIFQTVRYFISVGKYFLIFKLWMAFTLVVLFFLFRWVKKLVCFFYQEQLKIRGFPHQRTNELHESEFNVPNRSCVQHSVSRSYVDLFVYSWKDHELLGYYYCSESSQHRPLFTLKSRNSRSWKKERILLFSAAGKGGK